MACWSIGRKDVCFVHLGKYGDIILMLPAFKAVADELGKPTLCLVASEFWSVFQGVSYVQPWVTALHWWRGVGEARRMAEHAGFEPIVVKWWDEPGARPPQPPTDAPTIQLTIHGQTHTIAASEWDSFQASQWRYAGFTVQQMMAWPLVFDRRDFKREELLRKRLFPPASGRPRLLVNLSNTGTSPFPHQRMVSSWLANCGFEVIDISRQRAHRIYDLLGLYDCADGLITTDTSTLHLAPASTIPYIAFLNNGGSGSIPRGNCIASYRYSHPPVKDQFLAQLERIRKAART